MNEIKTSKGRLRELDFLRGIAIVLVLFRHQFVYEFTEKAGWIGVDLFFVLSGFLASGLLFKEFQKFGNVRPKRFLIRRGFKIYPIYYLFYIPYLLPILIQDEFRLIPFLSDIAFIQNYVIGWGYAYAPSWSLAVEEHFYFGVAAAMFFLLRPNVDAFSTKVGRKINSFEIGILTVMLACLMARILSNIYFPTSDGRSITMTHLRIDSLLAGVLVSYWLHFKREIFVGFMRKYRKPLLMSAVILLSFTPFIEYTKSFFVVTIGFTLIYVAFAIVLAWILTQADINRILDRYFSSFVVNGFAKIGLASYSIYIIHSFVNYCYSVGSLIVGIQIPSLLLFILTSITSILCGFVMTNYIEKYFLSIRDRHFPARTE